MITAGDFKKGLTVEWDGGVWTIVDFQHVKPGKGAAFVRTKIKNIMTGAVVERSFNPTDKMPKAIIETKEMEYLYSDGELYYFMDPETYEQMPLPFDQVEEALNFIKENTIVTVRFFKGKGVLDGTGAIVVTAQLDLEAMEFAKTSKEVCDKVAAAEGDSAAITLTTAKPGFWYGVAVADSLAALENANAADAARATGDGVELTGPKPAGGTAFFKVLVNTQEIPVR